MAAIPRKAREPLSIVNSRGVLCANLPGMLVAKVVRKATLPTLTHVCGSLQSGGVPHGGTEYPAMGAKFFLGMQKAASAPGALVFLTSVRHSTASFPRWHWGQFCGTKPGVSFFTS